MSSFQSKRQRYSAASVSRRTTSSSDDGGDDGGDSDEEGDDEGDAVLKSIPDTARREHGEEEEDGDSNGDAINAVLHASHEENPDGDGDGDDEGDGGALVWKTLRRRENRDERRPLVEYDTSDDDQRPASVSPSKRDDFISTTYLR